MIQSNEAWDTNVARAICWLTSNTTCLVHQHASPIGYKVKYIQGCNCTSLIYFKSSEASMNNEPPSHNIFVYKMRRPRTTNRPHAIAQLCGAHEQEAAAYINNPNLMLREMYSAHMIKCPIDIHVAKSWCDEVEASAGFIVPTMNKHNQQQHERWRNLTESYVKTLKWAIPALCSWPQTVMYK